MANTYNVLIIFTNRSKKLITGTTTYGFLQDLNMFYIDKNEIRGYFPNEHIVFFGLQEHWEEKEKSPPEKTYPITRKKIYDSDEDGYFCGVCGRRQLVEIEMPEYHLGDTKEHGWSLTWKWCHYCGKKINWNDIQDWEEKYGSQVYTPSDA